ncbi:MAG: diaminopimelate epimerase [Gammaproteobacteria bacterium]|nr:diaminopimelate epimerase [Gammaproteobacteria bacterium]
MNLLFTKMHGLGNDFVVIDAISQKVSLTLDQIRLLSDRHFGVGCDQLLLLDQADNPEVDFCYRIFNADGSVAEQCGNGVRCLAKFIHDKKISTKTELNLKAHNRIIKTKLDADGEVTVDMGKPIFEPKQIPFLTGKLAPRYFLKIPSGQIEVGAVSMGNPHVVLEVANIDKAKVDVVGKEIAHLPQFPKGVNVNFVEIQDRNRILLRVFERGVGETLACGSGACASVVIGRKWGLLDQTVSVALRGGNLTVFWQDDEAAVFLKGPVVTVFDGALR